MTKQVALIGQDLETQVTFIEYCGKRFLLESEIERRVKEREDEILELLRSEEINNDHSVAHWYADWLEQKFRGEK